MDEPESRREIEWGPLLGGFFAGWFMSWVAYVVAAFALIVSSRWDEGLSQGRSGAAWEVVIGEAILWLLPVVLVLCLLWQRFRRQIVTGALLGWTIRAIVGAGVCRAWLAGLS